MPRRSNPYEGTVATKKTRVVPTPILQHATDDDVRDNNTGNVVSDDDFAVECSSRYYQHNCVCKHYLLY